jgi:NAD(P)-dependent dehydrogenase (short-subunit alcohol dehydrogenase family)
MLMSNASDQTLPLMDFERLTPQVNFRLVVIGSHGGIGSALCHAAEAIGMNVIGLDTESAIAEKPDALKGRSIAVDVRDEGSIDGAFEQIRQSGGAIDGLAYVTGIGIPPTPAVNHRVEQWDKTMEVNLRGAFLVSVRARPLLSRDASVVFVSSGLAIQAEPGFAAYSASKAGLIALAKTLAKEWAPVRVNAIAPGLVNTAFLAGGAGQGQPSHATLEDWFGADRARAILDTIPMKRIALPDDVVAPMLFLLAAGSRFITGQTLHVNGGRLSL